MGNRKKHILVTDSLAIPDFMKPVTTVCGRKILFVHMEERPGILEDENICKNCKKKHKEPKDNNSVLILTVIKPHSKKCNNKKKTQRDAA